jgi:hypothetical protein
VCREIAAAADAPPERLTVTPSLRMSPMRAIAHSGCGECASAVLVGRQVAHPGRHGDSTITDAPSWPYPPANAWHAGKNAEDVLRDCSCRRCGH